MAFNWRLVGEHLGCLAVTTGLKCVFLGPRFFRGILVVLKGAYKVPFRG